MQGVAALTPPTAGVGASLYRSARHHSRGGKAQSEMWENLTWFRGPQTCHEAGAMGFSDSGTSRHCWEQRTEQSGAVEERGRFSLSQ